MEPPVKITQATRETWSYHTFENTQFFRTYSVLLWLLKRMDDFVYLCVLMSINELKYRDKKNKKTITYRTDYNGWFPCSFKRIKYYIPTLSLTTESRIINRLKKKGYIHVKRSGLGAKRMFFIDGDKIASDCSDMLAEDSS
jgi:hypothetical protein